MVRVGITGASGFVGTHLRFFLYGQRDKYKPISVQKSDFSTSEKLAKKLKRCDIVVHLAGLNRGEEKEIYEINTKLTKTILTTLDKINKRPKIIFLSSTHNTRNTAYGRSKRDSEKMILDWGTKNRVATFSIVAPHIFGEFAQPYYNSAIASLAYELSKNKKSVVNPDAKVELIYIQDICCLITSLFKKKSSKTIIPNGKKMQLTDIYSLLKNFRDVYFFDIFPKFKNNFELQLFNTFRSYLYPNHFPVNLDLKKDERGAFVEVVKTKTRGQISFSTTHPNIVRGNHYHTRKIERFCVIKGKAEIKIRRLFSKKVYTYKVSGKRPVYIDMPTFHTHSIKNIGKKDLLTIFWINEIYDPKDPDTFPELVKF
ncbi:MAG: NAD-dependent epimerase/dehydratase family protein [Candidatus Woesebacteria bacterium]|nr:MAG: NAD-dependent epimerase/dehydratase family protein [Candidatus Woesebacteria bacterium]